MSKTSDADLPLAEADGEPVRRHSGAGGDQKGSQRGGSVSSAPAASPVRPCAGPGRLWLAAGANCQCDHGRDRDAVAVADLQRVTRALVDRAERARAREGQQERLRRCCARLQLRLGVTERTVH